MRLPFLSSVGLTETVLLVRHLAVTLKAGVPLARALAMLEREMPRSRRGLARHLRRSVEHGNSLAHAMGTAPRAFMPLAINLVRTGERSGTLEESLETLAEHLRRLQSLRRKIRSAMLYPGFVLIAITGLGLSIGVFVLPKLIPLFQSLDVQLPLMTRLLLGAAEFFEQHGLVFSGGVIGGLILVIVAFRTPVLRPLWHWVLLRIPYVSAVVRSAALARLTRTLGTFLQSGVPLREALPATADAMENVLYRKALRSSVPVIERGRKLSDAWKRAGGIMPDLTVMLTEIGEETGTLTAMLDELAEYYEGEVNYALKNLMTALEPVLLIIVGIIVGAVVLAIITPIYEITGRIG